MAKKEKEEKEKIDLKTLLGQMNKKYGQGAIGIAASSKGVAVPRIPFGVLALDYASGGGIPYGRISGFHGMKSCGKTSNALRIVASAQKMCREHLVPMVPTDEDAYICPECGYVGDGEGEQCPFCDSAGIESFLIDIGRKKCTCPVCSQYNPMVVSWYDFEGAFCNTWAARFGVDCSKVILTRPECAEQGIDIIDGIMKTGEVDLFVIDSIACMTPASEADDSAEATTVGLQARLVNKMLRKFSAAMNKPVAESAWRPTVIMINQMRQKVGVLFGSPDVLPAGMGQEFATSMDIKFNPSKLVDDKQGNPQYQVSTFRCVKNKCSVPHRVGAFRMWLDYDPDGHYPTDTEETGVILKFADKAELFGDSKTGWKLFDKEFKTKKAAMQFALGDYETFTRLRSELLECRLGELDTSDGGIDVKALIAGEDSE